MKHNIIAVSATETLDNKGVTTRVIKGVAPHAVCVNL